MIQAQFISSWWHWSQVFNWKEGNEDPNRKVVLRENKWHYVVILLKRNKTKTSLNTWGFQQKRRKMKSPMSELLCPLSRWAPPTKGRADNIKFNFSFKDTCAKEKLRQYMMMSADVQKCKWLFLWKINEARI